MAPLADRLLLFFAANAYDRAEYAEGYAVCESPSRQVWLDEVTWVDGKPVVKGPTGTSQSRP
ncbi:MULTISPECIES: hypothetical protein [unclassified Micromonospora]|uniref:hypothetical protein n=1 Tax=unclassified Micromonospora TaxID=2617518 RepID=UPI001788DE5C|nr:MULTISPECIES: hypothetical protein [unclassified Micromonospora]MDG4761835.1 hypothetical protein [Micromonospora sp. WMMD710]